MDCRIFIDTMTNLIQISSVQARGGLGKNYLIKPNERNSNQFRVPFRFAKALCHATTSFCRSTTRLMGIQPVTAQAGTGLFPYRAVIQARPERHLNPRAGRVAPVGHQPGFRICDSRAEKDCIARRLRARDSQSCPNHNPLPQGMAIGRLAEKLCRRYKTVRRALKSYDTRKLAAPGLEGGVVRAKESVRKPVLEPCEALVQLSYRESLKPETRLDTKQVRQRQINGKKSVVAACSARHQVLPVLVIVLFWTMKTQFCLKCSADHLLHYTRDSQDHVHLILECPKGHYALRFMPHLDIPMKESRKLLKARAKLEAQAKQPMLF